MSPLRYHRPKTIGEAVGLLREGVPLAGGTKIVPRRRTLESVVDLQDLALDTLRPSGERLEIGAMCRLQDLLTAASTVPDALVEACRGEAGWNLRNMITLGGTLAAEDGRSRVLTVLTAMKAEIAIEPGGVVVPINELLAGRPRILEGRLITAVRLPRIMRAEYRQVARSLADKPIVSAAACRGRGDEGKEFIHLALGGFGGWPREITLDLRSPDGVIDKAAELAQTTYALAGDEWAAADYRSHVAGVLARRVVAEVIN